MDTSDGFSPPSNWCDGHCEVCPLDGDCRVRVRMAQRRWVHSARGEDPDDPAVVWADVVRDLNRAIGLVQDIAREEGICLDEPQPDLPVSLASKRRYRSGLRLFQAMCHLDRCEDADTQALADVALGNAATLLTKVGRIAAYDEPDDPVWFADAVPNLMLIEHLLGSVESSLEAMRPRLRRADQDRLDRARADLRRDLDGHLLAIPRRARTMLSVLVGEGRAPSPFCTVGT